MFTRTDVDDRNSEVSSGLIENFVEKLLTDKGYIFKKLFERVLKRN